MARKSERIRHLWESNLSLYEKAFKASADGWAKLQAEKKQLLREREQLIWKIELLTTACEGGIKSRKKMEEDMEALREKNLELEKENRELNGILDKISAEKNGALIKQLFETK